jgi:Na+-driven multidrug efflux pump
MSMNPKVKNPLVLSIVSTVFLIPVLILTHYLFRESAFNAWWIIMIVNVVIYFVLIFLVFLYYGNIGKKK